jgi:hypothetical protein
VSGAEGRHRLTSDSLRPGIAPECWLLPRLTYVTDVKSPSDDITESLEWRPGSKVLKPLGGISGVTRSPSMRTADSPTVTTTSALSHRVPILVFSWMLRVFKFKSAYYPDVRWSGIHEIWIGGTPGAVQNPQGQPSGHPRRNAVAHHPPLFPWRYVLMRVHSCKSTHRSARQAPPIFTPPSHPINPPRPHSCFTREN